MVKEIKKDGYTYFVCDCKEMHLTHITPNNKQICSKCKFRLESDVIIR